MNKAVFTDFDGVINTESDWKKGLYTFRKDKAMLIAEKVLHDDALLVITSSWRLGFTENDDDISIIHFFHDAGIEHVYQTAALPDKRRTAEIERFLYYHREIKEYLIIDDDIVRGSSVNYHMQSFRGKNQGRSCGLKIMVMCS